jgi:hypothetical protein
VPSSLPAIRARLESAPKKAGSRFAIIVDWARKAIDDGIDAVGVEELVSRAVALYDAYVQPIDVPWVPDILEPTLIDLPAKQILAVLIRGLAEMVDDDGTDVDPPDNGGLE